MFSINSVLSLVCCPNHQLKFSTSMPGHASALLWPLLREAQLSEIFIRLVLSFHHRDSRPSIRCKNGGPSKLMRSKWSKLSPFKFVCLFVFIRLREKLLSTLLFDSGILKITSTKVSRLNHFLASGELNSFQVPPYFFV